MLSLAVYESYTPSEDRPNIDEFLEGWAEKGSGEERFTKQDPLGNIMVESARQLSGVEQKMKPPNKPKKPKALKRRRGRSQKLKGRGRGEKTSRGRKSTAKGKAPPGEPKTQRKISETKMEKGSRKRRSIESGVVHRRLTGNGLPL